MNLCQKEHQDQMALLLKTICKWKSFMTLLVLAVALASITPITTKNVNILKYTCEWR